MKPGTTKAIWVLRLAGLLKAVFLVFLFVLDRYKHKLIQEDSGPRFLSGLKIDLPFYFFALGYTVMACYFFSLVASNAAAWRPCSGPGRFYRRKQAGVWIIAVEVILLIAGCVAAVIQFHDAFEPGNKGLVDRVFHFFLDTKNTEKLIRAGKLEALNMLLPVIASLLLLIAFRKITKALAEQCADVDNLRLQEPTA
ncbi:MAG: hypothetical protein U0U70_11020 [Chitinophagaceae bacterium]